MAELDKWQERQARALAEADGISYEAAVHQVLGTTRPRKAPAVKAPEAPEGK